MPEQSSPVNAALPSAAASNGSQTIQASAGARISVDELLTSGSRAQKLDVVYSLLRSMLGERVERELGVFDADGFLYACIMSPGRREALRLLEDPERARRLEEPIQDVVPLRDILEQLNATK